MNKRHGDLKFTKVNGFSGKKLNTLVVAKGEHTNHSHRFEGGKVALYQDGDTMFVNVLEPSNLVHEEHKPIKFDKGVYKVSYEREFDYFLQEVRKVQD